jgi:hypothetical protein
MIGTFILLAVYFVLASAVFYTAFCRLTMTTHKTTLWVRGWLWLIAAVSASSLAVTVVYGYIPVRWHVAALAALFMLQLHTRERWANGVPRNYTSPQKNHISVFF